MPDHFHPQSSSDGCARSALPSGAGRHAGIPQDARPTIRLLSSESAILPGSHSLCLTPEPVLTRSQNGQLQFTGYTNNTSPALQVDTFSPANIAELVTTGYLRSQRFAELRFNPLQYNPASGEVRYYSRIQIELKLNSVGQTVSLSYKNSEGFFEDSLRSLLLNYDQARSWRSKPSPAVQPEADHPQNQSAYKILVDQDGLYQVSYTDLQTAACLSQSSTALTRKLSSSSTRPMK